MIQKSWRNRVKTKPMGMVFIAIFVFAFLYSHYFSERLSTSSVKAQAAEIQVDEQPSTVPLYDDIARKIFVPLVKQPFNIFLPLAQYGNAAPEVYGPFPANDATRQSLNVYLVWSHTEDPEGDDYIFKVYLEADDETPDELIGETTGQFWVPPFTLHLNTQYYWQVVAVDERGTINDGPVWTFRTEDLPDPPPVDEMIFIPAGEFSMGCDQTNPSQACRPDEFPLHIVYLDSYEIDKYLNEI
jgi:hypothetical protein